MLPGYVGVLFRLCFLLSPIVFAGPSPYLSIGSFESLLPTLLVGFLKTGDLKKTGAADKKSGENLVIFTNYIFVPFFACICDFVCYNNKAQMLISCDLFFPYPQYIVVSIVEVSL